MDDGCIFHIFSYHPLMQSKFVRCWVGQKLLTFAWLFLHIDMVCVQLATSCDCPHPELWMNWFYFLLLCLILYYHVLSVLEENLQKLRSNNDGALELEHLEPPEDMVMDPARAKLAKFQALALGSAWSASPKAGYAGCTMLHPAVQPTSTVFERMSRCPRHSPNGRQVFKCQ